MYWYNIQSYGINSGIASAIWCPESASFAEVAINAYFTQFLNFT